MNHLYASNPDKNTRALEPPTSLAVDERDGLGGKRRGSEGRRDERGSIKGIGRLKTLPIRTSLGGKDAGATETVRRQVFADLCECSIPDVCECSIAYVCEV